MKNQPSELHAVSIGTMYFIFRPSKARGGRAGSLGSKAPIIVAGGVIIRPGKPARPGTMWWQVGADVPAHIEAQDAAGPWIRAGVLIGERFSSFDRQPKFKGEVFCMTRKRTDDFKHAEGEWNAWRAWRESGAKQTFEVFRFGPVKDTDIYRSTSRAAVQLLASIGLSLACNLTQ